MIREATPDDVPDILRLIRELAVYERAPDAVEATEDLLHRALFAEQPKVFCHLACGDDTGAAVGLALWFVNFSTWLGCHGIWLEDLFVEPEHRGKGYGLDLLRTLARICVERGYGRLEWWVLDWNEPALRFYRSLGAEPMDEWTVQRLTGPALTALAAP
jgi:GNAT superfamily N-acetyltransferase